MANTLPVKKSALLDVANVAQLLCCSVRHVYRLADAGKMPRPLKLGGANRWRRDELEEWILNGCPHFTDSVKTKVAEIRNSLRQKGLGIKTGSEMAFEQAAQRNEVEA